MRLADLPENKPTITIASSFDTKQSKLTKQTSIKFYVVTIIVDWALSGHRPQKQSLWQPQRNSSMQHQLRIPV